MEIKENEKIIVARILCESYNCWFADFENSTSTEIRSLAKCIEHAINESKAKDYQLIPTETNSCGMVRAFLLLLKVDKDFKGFDIL